MLFSIGNIFKQITLTVSLDHIKESYWTDRTTYICVRALWYLAKLPDTFPRLYHHHQAVHDCV